MSDTSVHISFDPENPTWAPKRSPRPTSNVVPFSIPPTPPSIPIPALELDDAAVDAGTASTIDPNAAGETAPAPNTVVEVKEAAAPSTDDAHLVAALAAARGRASKKRRELALERAEAEDATEFARVGACGKDEEEDMLGEEEPWPPVAMINKARIQARGAAERRRKAARLLEPTDGLNRATSLSEAAGGAPAAGAPTANDAGSVTPESDLALAQVSLCNACGLPAVHGHSLTCEGLKLPAEQPPLDAASFVVDVAGMLRRYREGVASGSFLERVNAGEHVATGIQIEAYSHLGCTAGGKPNTEVRRYFANHAVTLSPSVAAGVFARISDRDRALLFHVAGNRGLRFERVRWPRYPVFDLFTGAEQANDFAALVVAPNPLLFLLEVMSCDATRHLADMFGREFVSAAMETVLDVYPGGTVAASTLMAELVLLERLYSHAAGPGVAQPSAFQQSVHMALLCFLTGCFYPSDPKHCLPPGAFGEGVVSSACNMALVASMAYTAVIQHDRATKPRQGPHADLWDAVTLFCDLRRYTEYRP